MVLDCGTFILRSEVQESYHPFKEAPCWPSQRLIEQHKRFIPDYSGDPTSAPPITAGCQNNRIVQTPKQDKIQDIPHLSPEVFEH
ncbi:hypothetical protein AVEN_262041-1 [Araneus ventricosus]|uniref:Uncharacterized protein n=1 Tax=Araneus ventricosus TaxID=182803 RepID=A0A4Y2Q4E6_ARAVE|nr:hypothetical protein AVEN_262041-1 [Araneus ventricosus]